MLWLSDLWSYTNFDSSVKKTIFWSLYEYKGCNAQHFITEFLNKSWTKNSINRLLVKFGTVERNSPESGRSSHTGENVDTVESLLLHQEDKPQNHRTVREISREAGDPSIISFADYSQRSASRMLQVKSRSTADWSAQHARLSFGTQFERRIDNKQTYLHKNWDTVYIMMKFYQILLFIP